MIEVKHLYKTFVTEGRRGHQEVQALADLNFDIRDNEFVSLIGPSGCGKTTFIKILDGLIPYDAGELRIDGRPVTGPGPDRAMVFQNFALMPWADVLTNIAFPLELRGMPRKEREDRARRYIEMVGLGGFEHHYPHEISGGMQQRVGLARALAADPDILLMDEPFASVDAQTKQLLQEDLLRLWQEHRKTVVFITHAMDEAVYLSDRVVLLYPRPGRVGEVLEVPLRRPRDAMEVRRSAEFVELTQYLWRRLRELILEAQREGAAGVS